MNRQDMTLLQKAEAELDNPDTFERMILATPEEIIALHNELAEAKSLLAEALEWLERPIADANDVPLFLDFESRAKEMTS